MTRRLFLKFALFTIIGLAGLTWGTQSNASAVAPMCAMLAPAYNVSSPALKTDCLKNWPNGQDYTKALSDLSGGNLSLKSQFINKMLYFESSKAQHLQNVSATYIEDRISGSSGYNWQDRLNSSDVTLSVGSWYNSLVPDYNGAYDPATDKVVPYYEPAFDTPALLFTINGKIVMAIKLNCGNTLGNLPPIPSPYAIITGTKVSTTGSPGAYSSDVISAKVGIPSNPASDNSNPFTLNVKTGPASVTAANASKNWELVGYDRFTCFTATAQCSNPPGQYVPVTVAWGTPYTYALTDNAKGGYTYDIKFYYQPIPPLKLVTINGKKVDTTGKTNSAIDGDPIRVNSNAGTVFDTSNPFSFTNLPAGQISITPDYLSGYTVVGYTVCNYTPPASSCTPLSFLAPTPGSTYGPVQATPGQIYNMIWIFRPDICIGPSCCSGPLCTPAPPCPTSGLANPKSVSVSLPEPRTPTNQPTTPTTNPNPSSYLQYTPTGTKVTSVQDISSGTNRTIVPLLTSGSTQNPAVLDYSPYITAFPYDNSQPRVVYDSNYTVTPWTLSFDHNAYSCPYVAGSVLVSGPDASHKCTYSTTTGGVHNDPVGVAKTTITYCTSGGTWNGSTTSPSCGTHTSSTATSYTYSCPLARDTTTGTGANTTCPYKVYIGPSADHWTCKTSSSTWNNIGKGCPSSQRNHNPYCAVGIPISTSCYSVGTDPTTKTPFFDQVPYPISSSSSTTYTCPAHTPPYTSGGGTTNICTYDDTKVVMSNPFAVVTVWYKYTAGKSYPITESNNTGSTAPTMQACYNRGFSVTAINAGSAVSLNNYENPTTATAGGYSAMVKFSYTNVAPTQGLRQPMKVVNLVYSYKFSTGCTGSGTFGVTGGLSDSGPSSYPVPAAPGCGVSAPSLQPGDKVCVSYRASPTGSTMDINGNIVINNGGTVSTSPSTPQCSGPVVNEPYFKVFGGDISVGGTFAITDKITGATTCNSNSNNGSSGVYGWNTAGGAGVGGGAVVYGPTQTYAGAGAQFGVAALGVITGVASNQNNLNATPWAMPTAGSSRSDSIGLSFSNASTNAPNGAFGGNFGSAPCMPDYYASQPKVTTPLGWSADLTSIASGAYNLNGGSTINSSNIQQGKHIVVYAAGDVYIGGNISFDASYPSIDQVPSLVLVAKGNIYINSSVSTLSGVFIAQPVNPTASPVNDGVIYDCATRIGVLIANTSLYGSCGNQLTVNGSFIANKVVLMRTGNATNDKIASSLRRSSPNETNTATNATEIFNYSPAFWMNVGLPQLTSTSAGYDSIISLPPIL